LRGFACFVEYKEDLILTPGEGSSGPIPVLMNRDPTAPNPTPLTTNTPKVHNSQGAFSSQDRESTIVVNDMAGRSSKPSIPPISEGFSGPANEKLDQSLRDDLISLKPPVVTEGDAPFADRHYLSNHYRHSSDHRDAEGTDQTSRGNNRDSLGRFRHSIDGVNPITELDLEPSSSPVGPYFVDAAMGVRPPTQTMNDIPHATNRPHSYATPDIGSLQSSPAIAVVHKPDSIPEWASGGPGISTRPRAVSNSSQIPQLGLEKIAEDIKQSQRGVLASQYSGGQPPAGMCDDLRKYPEPSRQQSIDPIGEFYQFATCRSARISTLPGHEAGCSS
jgi:hypothetical protein